jgi:hypothetical protein
MNTYFLEAIQRLRQTEAMILLDKIFDISTIENQKVIEFLAAEYENEKWAYPSVVPPFEASAALWGAKTMYFACQYLLNRSQDIAAVKVKLVDFEGEVSAGAMLSADLCLRFLPQIATQARLMNADDPLFEILEKFLKKWHYSAINYAFYAEKVDFDFESEAIFQDKCFFRLYIDRITVRKDIVLAQNPFFAPYIKGDLGIYQTVFWKF